MSAPITDPQVIAFCNDVLRPLAESTRALVARISDANIKWQATIAALVPADAGAAITDNRVAEGVTELTGMDINQLVSTLTAMSAASNAQIISKPCVQPLNVLS